MDEPWRGAHADRPSLTVQDFIFYFLERHGGRKWCIIRAMTKGALLSTAMSGAFAAMFTPFDRKGRVSEEAIDALIVLRGSVPHWWSSRGGVNGHRFLKGQEDNG